MAALTVFLLVCGNSVSAVVLILIVWALVLLTGLILTYWKRKRQMKKLLDMAKQLSERYLISEVMELPEQAEDQVYYCLLYTSKQQYSDAEYVRIGSNSICFSVVGRNIDDFWQYE